MASKIKENIGWIQVFTIIVAVFGMFTWGQREYRSETRSIRAEIRAEMNNFQNAIKDFHGRLCQLEEKYYQLERKVDDR